MKRDAIATGVSVAAHATVLGLLFLATMPPHRTTIDVAIIDPGHAAPTSGAAPSAPPAAPATPKRQTHARRTVAFAPTPAADAPPLPIAHEEAPIAPEDSDDSDDGEGTPGVGGIGGTGNGAGGTGSGAAGDGSGAGTDRSRAPDLDRESCTRDLSYPWRAELLNKEGIVRLRVTLDAGGKVRDAVVIGKAGYGFDEAAVQAVLTRCRFTAALDHDGQPTRFVIDDYRFYFRFADFPRTSRYAAPH